MINLDSRLIPETPPELVQEQVDGLLARLKREQGISIRETEQPRGWREKSGRLKAELISPEHPLVRTAADASVRSPDASR